MERIPGCPFTMGCRSGLFGRNRDCSDNERPLRRVEVHGFAPRACSHYRNASMMRAKPLHPGIRTARCSPREQRRRHPCKRRNTRAPAIRRVSLSRSYAQGSPRVRRGDPSDSSPRAPARGWVLAPSDARSRSSVGLSGCGLRRTPPLAARRVGGRAHRHGTPRPLGGPPPRGRPREGAGCVSAPGPAGGTLTRGRALDRAASLRRPSEARCRGARPRARTPGCDQRGSRGEREGRAPTGPAPRALCRPARPQTTWR